MAIVLVAAIMIHYLSKRRSWPPVPAGFGVWLLFLAWMIVSVIGIDSGGRMIGFTYRAMLYLAITVAFIYVYADRNTFTLERTTRFIVGFWFALVAGGYLGMLWPLFSLKTPMYYALPSGLLSNDFVSEMAIRRFTQYDPDAYKVVPPRPSAPFAYTNGWGNAYSILTPIVIAHAVEYLRGRRRTALLAVVAVSAVPALLSLNRGMFIGLGIAAVYIAARGAARGNVRILGGIIVSFLMTLLLLAVLPVRSRLDDRLATNSSTDGRTSLYNETISRAMESPIFGFGGPRPSTTPWLPSVGTHGHVWTLLISHGVPAVILFMAWLVVMFHHTAAHRGPVGLAVNAGVLVLLVEIFYYGVLGMGLLTLMICVAAAWLPVRNDHPPPPCPG